MHNDEIIWSCLKKDCSYKARMKAPALDFCRNKYNHTGLCNRTSCPLSNSQYATVIEEEGIAYLYMKTVERAHSPKNLWERVKLSRNFLEALDQINKQLEYWDGGVINRCKQRLTKIRQMLVRMRRLQLRQGDRVRLVPIKKKTERREKTRELKAEAAAKVDLAIEKELLERLKQGVYGDIYNFNQKKFDEMLDGEQQKEEEAEDEDETEFVEDLDDDDSDADYQDVGKVEEVEFDGPGMADLEDMDELAGSVGQPSRKRRRGAGPKVELEYEEEREMSARVE